ncbi:unnamed protein product [Phytophthora fragariaefolia]|uniref:Unnamed protein product n=1 Tax=Phytophthora fragariaefolia TaxID=1490495 RepID=A0A9W6XUM6_9STRA|nr:unnamed protein product [Phytophthora fragariaefolia]
MCHTNSTTGAIQGPPLAGRSAPTLGYQDLLTNPATIPAIGDNATQQQRNEHLLETAFLQEQESYLRDLFNQTPPHGYMTQLSIPLASQSVPQFWRQLEADFGQSNAMGMVELIAEFERTLAMNFSSISELFQRLRAVRNRLNRQGQETLHVHLLPSQLMIGKVLALIPSHLWGPSVMFTPEELTLEKVEKKMKSIFGNKSRAETQSMGKAASSVPVKHAASVGAGGKRAPTKKLGKRKGGIDEAACFYCKGKYNEMGGVGPHFKQDCPKRKHDMALGIGCKDIHSEPKPLKIRKTDHVRMQKVQPAKQEVRVEIPVDAASLQKLSNSQSGTTEPTSEDLPATPSLHGTRDPRPISTIHMDTNGPMKTIGVYGTVGTIRYFLSIIDDQTSWRWTYVLRNKTEVNDKVKTLLLQLERVGKFTIRRIRSDGCTEFVNQAFNKFCKDEWILFQKSNA